MNKVYILTAIQKQYTDEQDHICSYCSNNCLESYSKNNDSENNVSPNISEIAMIYIYIVSNLFYLFINIQFRAKCIESLTIRFAIEISLQHIEWTASMKQNK